MGTFLFAKYYISELKYFILHICDKITLYVLRYIILMIILKIICLLADYK